MVFMINTDRRYFNPLLNLTTTNSLIVKILANVLMATLSLQSPGFLKPHVSQRVSAAPGEKNFWFSF